MSNIPQKSQFQQDLNKDKNVINQPLSDIRGSEQFRMNEPMVGQSDIPQNIQDIGSRDANLVEGQLRRDANLVVEGQLGNLGQGQQGNLGQGQLGNLGQGQQGNLGQGQLGNLGRDKPMISKDILK